MKITGKFITEHSKIPGEKAILNNDKERGGVHIQGELILILLHVQNFHGPVIILSLCSLPCVLIPPAPIICSEVLANHFTNVFFFPTEVAASFLGAIVNLLCLEGKLLLSQKNEVT